MVGGYGRGGGWLVKRRPRLLQRSQDTKGSLPAHPVCLCGSPSERREKSNYRAPKDLIIGSGSFACVRASPAGANLRTAILCLMWSHRATAQSLSATFTNDQIKCLPSLTPPFTSPSLWPMDDCFN